MSRHVYRFFAAEVQGGIARLHETDLHHLRVLRLGVGDTCGVVAGGRVHGARIAAEGVELLEEVGAVVSAPPVTVWIAQPGGGLCRRVVTRGGRAEQ